jgi:predicted nucleotidyltransferase
MEHISYNIIKELQKQNLHIRELSKLLNVNHMSILRKLKLLEEENIVDFKYEGKNKVYFLKNSIETYETIKILEHYKLIDIIKKYPLLRKIVQVIKEKDIELAILFGSYAKDNNTKKSDIDIYIMTKDKRLKKELELLNSGISVKLGEFDKKNLLIQEIIKNHIIIKGIDKYYELIHKKDN